MRSTSPSLVGVGSGKYNTYVRNSVDTTSTLSSFASFYSNSPTTAYSGAVSIVLSNADIGMGVTVAATSGNGAALDDEL